MNDEEIQFVVSVLHAMEPADRLSVCLTVLAGTVADMGSSLMSFGNNAEDGDRAVCVAVGLSGNAVSIRDFVVEKTSEKSHGHADGARSINAVVGSLTRRMDQQEGAGR